MDPQCIPLDLFFARRALAQCKEAKEEHVEVLCRLMAFARQGHLALPIEEALTLPELPCIKREDNYLYLQKNWVCEREIVFHMHRLLQAAPKVSMPLLPHLPSLNEEQNHALLAAQKYPVSLLIGGPGTGKTYTAAHIIKALADQQAQIVLAAPTGKAAAQLDAYLRRFYSSDTGAIRSGTLHALLGLKKESDFDTDSIPLFADAIIVDECSMIDAKLFLRLLSCTLEGTRLILIGDPDQLPSVEAGSIFGDLVSAAQAGFALPMTQLTQSLRSERQEIVDFSLHIRKAETENVVAALTSSSAVVQGLELDLKESLRNTIYHTLWTAHRERFVSFYQEKPDPGALMPYLETFRLLSCLRQGAFGVDAINHFFAQQFFNEATVDTWWAIPILITRSDYSVELYNGDAGFLVRHIGASSSYKDVGRQDYALFPDRAQGVRSIAAALLPAFEFSYCLSVHKSQGSEYDEVFILIPPGSESFGREILYTAATRARAGITCAGSFETIEKMVQNSARKISSLSARLKNKLPN